MLMKEFVTRFATENESSFLFEILRRVSRLDPAALQASASDPAPGWVEWPNDGTVPALRAAQA